MQNIHNDTLGILLCAKTEYRTIVLTNFPRVVTTRHERNILGFHSDHLILLNFTHDPRGYFTISDVTHSGWVTHICLGHLITIGSDNGLAPTRHQMNQFWDIVKWNLGIKLQWIKITSFRKRRLKVLSAKRRPLCLGLNVLAIRFPWCHWDNHEEHG